MIALGGVIGAGLFVGSGAGIAAAGPSIVVAYALSGLLSVRPPDWRASAPRRS